MSDDVLYEVSVSLPVVLRFWAADETGAMELYGQCHPRIEGPMQSFSVGFPIDLKVTEVEQEPIAIVKE